MGHVPAHRLPYTKTQLRFHFLKLYEMYEKLSLQLSSKLKKLGNTQDFYLQVFNEHIKITFVFFIIFFQTSATITLGRKSLNST